VGKSGCEPVWPCEYQSNVASAAVTVFVPPRTSATTLRPPACNNYHHCNYQKMHRPRHGHRRRAFRRVLL
jgi:hypothetical protein